MRPRRFLPVLATALAVLTATPASAQVGFVTQEVPSTIWTQPGPPGDLNDGVGTWVYVLPQAPVGPSQRADSYDYALSFSFPGLGRLGFISLYTGQGGTRARLSLTEGSATVDIPYNWSPGRFYFLYVHHLQNGHWGGWVMDWDAGVWSYIGSVQAPAGWGLLTKSSRTRVWWPGAAGTPTACSAYPRTDAYFFPTLGYTGSNFTIGTFDFHHAQEGNCPTQTEILPNSWVHYRLGADPT